jgi:hypothetical protein
MTPEDIKAKSSELAALYTAKANGRTLQYDVERRGFLDHPDDDGPSMVCNLSRWRVKPEPRRMWETPSASSFTNNHNVRTHHQNEADEWRAKGYKVTEWQEVLP